MLWLRKDKLFKMAGVLIIYVSQSRAVFELRNDPMMIFPAATG